MVRSRGSSKALLLLLLLIMCLGDGLRVYPNRRKQQRVQMMETKSPFWIEGLQFACTGCGKCCRNDGEVWLDSDEFVSLCDHLQLDCNEVIDKYADSVMNGWVKLKNKVSSEMNSVKGGNIVGDSCIFLDDDGKKCTIYEARPIQCRTYPYWPRLLANISEWENEAVVPDSESGKHWTPEEGGCEGINHKDAALVAPTIIHRNHELYKAYNDVFPIMFSGDDRNRLLAKAEVIQGIIRSTKEWVKQIVIRLSLCPFAESVFSSNKIRYIVYFGHEKHKIIEKLKYEMLALLTSKEEDIATTLLVIPFAMQEFDEFHDFSLDVEDNIVKRLEADTNVQTEKPSNSLMKRMAQRKESAQGGRAKKESSGQEEIQLAFFHPGFCWADTDFHDAINYEKRSPFPTINLLRAKKVREYADSSKTRKIANANQESLTKLGSSSLQEIFANILRKAMQK